MSTLTLVIVLALVAAVAILTWWCVSNSRRTDQLEADWGAMQHALDNLRDALEQAIDQLEDVFSATETDDETTEQDGDSK